MVDSRRSRNRGSSCARVPTRARHCWSLLCASSPRSRWGWAPPRPWPRKPARTNSCATKAGPTPPRVSHTRSGLPDCRAYEMVSPLDKQAHDAGTGGTTGGSILPVVVAPDGETAGWSAEGAFAEPENYSVSNYTANNKYLSRRSASGWITSSAFAPRGLVDEPFPSGLDADLSFDMRSKQVSCGVNPPAKGERVGWLERRLRPSRGRRQMENHFCSSTRSTATRSTPKATSAGPPICPGSSSSRTRPCSWNGEKTKRPPN